jgi:hypothetical protein
MKAEAVATENNNHQAPLHGGIKGSEIRTKRSANNEMWQEVELGGIVVERRRRRRMTGLGWVLESLLLLRFVAETEMAGRGIGGFF